ncbi:MAG: hypothetical protein GEU82_14985 [Luteitalea sp.]|nr:hypothetical protein [Luteitalea sp.]
MVVVTLLLLAALAQQPPAPQPFPRPGTEPVRPAPTAPAEPAPADSAPQTPDVPATDGAPSAALLGLPIFPGAQFLASFDAGRGQRYYLFGADAPFVDVVTFYRTTLKQRGELVFDVPATHEFDVGRFREETMAFPPGVTVKDFQSQISQGYPNPRPGGEPARFGTVIQIVPAVPER